MDRKAWLKDQRHETEERYDTIWSPQYGEVWGLYPNATHQQSLQKFLNLFPQSAALLDAACGAGRYLPMLLAGGHAVTGVDQSAGMLAKAREKFPTVRLEKIGLQEMAFRATFDGAICMDALEHICPEDWTTVLDNFFRALKPGGWLYFTVEMAEAEAIRQAFERGQQAGLPLVYGEMPEEDVYHYYPPLDQVREWLKLAGFETVEAGEGDDYHHFIVRKAP